MEVQLNEADKEALAKRVAEILEEKLLKAATSKGSWDAVVKYGQRMAEVYLSTHTAEFEAGEVFKNLIIKEGKTEFQAMVERKVREFLYSDAALQKQVFSFIARAAARAAEEARDKLIQPE